MQHISESKGLQLPTILIQKDMEKLSFLTGGATGGAGSGAGAGGGGGRGRALGLLLPHP